ncbi:acyltransferase [Paramagnetospirillum magneticum]|uniref:Acetyltransferase n=1 Tax=Paramagnetospirillum magneticum (strain ATCC 700264 / AMB-1) TaxID=342108 RepID=Q2WB59_PARM1|nr:acyltransferase [Paramagnetospirillum magneticum]BAE48916.1 Acetyltransferase [Paramagnetospirillum magneticum AMB-1]
MADPHGFDHLFDDDTNPALRNQILTYRVSETMTDRERARLLNLPEGCRIRERAKILAPENFVCGKNVWIGEGAILDAMGGLEIGDNSQIGSYVMVWSHSSHKQAIRGETGTSRDRIEYKRTKIGSNVHIPGPTVIAPGVTIGNGVMIAPLSFVNEDLPDRAVFSPAREMRRLRTRIDQLEKKLEEILSSRDS